jgi:hypothetical protein
VRSGAHRHNQRSMTRDQQLALLRQKCIEAKPEIERYEEAYRAASLSGQVGTFGFGPRAIRLADVLLAVRYASLARHFVSYEACCGAKMA